MVVKWLMVFIEIDAEAQRHIDVQDYGHETRCVADSAAWGVSPGSPPL
jgi:hypothetical protein